MKSSIKQSRCEKSQLDAGRCWGDPTGTWTVPPELFGLAPSFNEWDQDNFLRRIFRRQCHHRSSHKWQFTGNKQKILFFRNRHALLCMNLPLPFMVPWYKISPVNNQPTYCSDVFLLVAGNIIATISIYLVLVEFINWKTDRILGKLSAALLINFLIQSWPNWQSWKNSLVDLGQNFGRIKSWIGISLQWADIEVFNIYYLLVGVYINGQTASWFDLMV